MARVPAADLWLMVLCTVRYSLHRQSYMPGVCLTLLQRYAGEFSLLQLSQIEEEVNAELHAAETRGEFVGAECDHKTWRQVALAAARIAKARANA